jgi:hypothetical protein
MLVAAIALTSAVAKSGGRTLHLATGDHAHIWLESGHEHEGSHSHLMVHEHADDVGSSVCDAHRHTCLDFELMSGDWRPSVKTGAAAVLPLFALPPVPLTAAEVVETQTLGVLRPSPTLGIPPPDLLRSTVLLI